MQSPFDLPEIRNHLSQFLSQHDVAACARVCRDWHESFKCFIWRSLKVDIVADEGTILPWATVEPHLDDIENLDYRGDWIRHYALERLSCPRLKILTLRLQTFNRPELILRHQILTHLDFGANPFTPPHDFSSFWSTVASCSSLRSLSVSKVDVTPKSWEYFWSVWSRLTVLHLRELGIQATVGSTSFFQDRNDSKIKELVLFNIHGLNGIDGYLSFLSLCPDLETFLWHHSKVIRVTSNSGGGGRKKMCDLLMDRTSTCPQLVNFSLKVPSSVSTLTKTTTTTDDEIVPFLILRMCLAPIQELTLGGSLFGSRCGQELLEQDGSSLRILELKDCPGVSSTMAHQLLCHLPNLESFSAPLVQDWDVKLDGEHDWVSLGLKKLCLGLDWLEIMSSVTENHGLFKQLGRLAALKSLMVTRYRCPVSKDLLDTYTHSALRFGQALRSLPDLETLDLTDTTQKFMEEDVSWMMDNWPSLKVVTGMLHSDQEMDLVLRTMFESQGVRKTAAKPSKVWIS